MIYVPTYNNNNCVVVQNSDTIRVYEHKPTSNSYVNYSDYYINSHYLKKNGTQYFGNNVNYTCESNITTDFYYRNDLSDILLSFIIIVVFCFYFPYKLFSSLFRRFL